MATDTAALYPALSLIHDATSRRGLNLGQDPAGAPGVGARGPGSREARLAGPGTGLAGSKKGEINALETAASLLLARGEALGLQERAAQWLGLSEPRLSGAGPLESNIATLGKRLSDRAYLTIDQSLTGASSLVQLRYDLSPSGSLRVETAPTAPWAPCLLHL